MDLTRLEINRRPPGPFGSNEMMRPFEVLTAEAAALRGPRPAKTLAALKMPRRTSEKFGRG